MDNTENITPEVSSPITEVEAVPSVPSPVATPVPAKAKRKFRRSDVMNSFKLTLEHPLFPSDEFEPFEFTVRLSLSQEAEAQRQKYFGLPAEEQNQQEKDQELKDLCDVLVEDPTGFDDYTPIAGKTPRFSFSQYVSTTNDPGQRAVLDMIVRAAGQLYWRKVLPREFRKQVPSSS